MGAASQKTLYDIIKSKYSFVQPKSNFPQQISGWRYTEQELQNTRQPQGESLKWPFKLYSDEGYIFTLISNILADDPTKRQRKFQSKCSTYRLLGQLKISVEMIQLLYSFYHNEVEEYLQIQVALETSNKYNTQQLTLTIFVYTGQNISSYAKAKLLSQAILLQRYVSRGGMCVISKLYHQYDQIQDLRQVIKSQSSDNPTNKEQEYFVEIAELVGDKIKAEEDEKLKTNIYQKELKGLYYKFNHFTLLKKVLMEPYIKTSLSLNCLLKGQAKMSYPSVDSSLLSGQQLIIKNNSPICETINQQTQPYNFMKNKSPKQPSDEFQFACEISQINIRDKKTGDHAEPINQSLSMAELQALLDKRVNFIRINCSQDDYLIFSDYTSIKEYNQLTKNNIGLIVNCGPTLCYNYYLNDCQYLWYYLSPLPNKTPADAVLYEYNIENVMFKATQAIITHANNNQKGVNTNNRILIHSAGQVFSNQNCAIAIGYMITRFLYTFQKAFDILNKHFKEFSKSNENQLTLNKIYIDQLQILQTRILMVSNPTYGITVNYNNYRVYQLSNNHSDPSQSLITRYIGQISNLNQLQSLPNHSHHLFIALSNQLTLTLSQLIQKWQKDSSIKAPQGLTGIKSMLGKEFEFRDSYLPKVKESICLILKFEFIDRSKHQKAFSNEFLFKFIDEVVSTNLKAQNIEKSFRKPAPFIPLYVGFEQQNPVNPSIKKTNPYNSKQKLTFKYPYLRPTWQSLRDDQCYFIVQVSQAGAYVQISKGKNWIGFEQDKQTYFQSIVKTYLYNIDEDKIWITEEGQESIFGDRLQLT